MRLLLFTVILINRVFNPATDANWEACHRFHARINEVRYSHIITIGGLVPCGLAFVIGHSNFWVPGGIVEVTVEHPRPENPLHPSHIHHFRSLGDLPIPVVFDNIKVGPITLSPIKTGYRGDENFNASFNSHFMNLYPDRVARGYVGVIDSIANLFVEAVWNTMVIPSIQAACMSAGLPIDCGEIVNHITRVRIQTIEDTYNATTPWGSKLCDPDTSLGFPLDTCHISWVKIPFVFSEYEPYWWYSQISFNLPMSNVRIPSGVFIPIDYIANPEALALNIGFIPTIHLPITPGVLDCGCLFGKWAYNQARIFYSRINSYNLWQVFGGDTTDSAGVGRFLKNVFKPSVDYASMVLYYGAGCWGDVFPRTGFIPYTDIAQASGLAATRLMYLVFDRDFLNQGRGQAGDTTYLNGGLGSSIIERRWPKFAWMKVHDMVEFQLWNPYKTGCKKIGTPSISWGKDVGINPRDWPKFDWYSYVIWKKYNYTTYLLVYLKLPGCDKND